MRGAKGDGYEPFGSAIGHKVNHFGLKVSKLGWKRV